MKKSRRRSPDGEPVAVLTRRRRVLTEPVAPPSRHEPTAGRSTDRLPPTTGRSPDDLPPAAGRLSGHLPPGTGGSRRIRTEAGQYLRAAAHDDAPARFGEPAAQADEAARRIWEIAFGLVVRRRFTPDTPLAEISRTVDAAVREHAIAALPMIEAEMVVRAALGEKVPTDEIDQAVLTAVHLLVFASLADELALADDELETLIAQAEKKSAGA